jgi:heptosyltransferase-2
LRELAAILPFFDAFVGPDSGPTHIAASAGVPTIFIYSGTNEWERWKPLAEDAIALRNRVECSPCEREVCPVKGHPCLSGIPAEEAIKALESKLKK